MNVSVFDSSQTKIDVWQNFPPSWAGWSFGSLVFLDIKWPKWRNQLIAMNVQRWVCWKKCCTSWACVCVFPLYKYKNFIRSRWCRVSEPRSPHVRKQRCSAAEHGWWSLSHLPKETVHAVCGNPPLPRIFFKDADMTIGLIIFSVDGLCFVCFFRYSRRPRPLL